MDIAKIEQLVWNSIERIERAEREWKEANQNPRSSTHQLSDAKYRQESVEREFAYQWPNVKALLEHYRKLEKSACEVVEQVKRVSSKEADLAQAQRDEMKRIGSKV